MYVLVNRRAASRLTQSRLVIRSAPAVVNGKAFDFILISRRSCFRAGTRYHTRGIDDLGNVANFVETEQIVYYSGQLCSYVQTRGSIPVFWRQQVNLKYKPRPAIETTQQTTTAFQNHFRKQLLTYGPQVLINLVDTKGSEMALAHEYQRLAQSSADLKLKCASVFSDIDFPVLTTHAGTFILTSTKSAGICNFIEWIY